MEDIPALAEYFIKFFSRKFGKNITEFSETTMKVLLSYNWPGNIREFRNVIERLIILCDNSITDDDVKNFAHPLWK
jgi:transcriptional regulator with PAS, ATPase and Fis domain